MAGRRALISTDDLRRMAKVAAEYQVSVKGKLDPMGNFTVDIAPVPIAARNDDSDDLDDRLARFGSR